MFLRKLLVICIPLAFMGLICLLSPLMNVTDFFTAGVIRGALLGIALALMLPLAGASSRREPFAGLLWVPAVLTIVLIGCQLCVLRGVSHPLLTFTAITDGQVVLIESAFGAYLLTTCIRTSIR